MIEAAMNLVATRGYLYTTLEAIGIEAGYSRGLVSHRFGSKERLIEEVLGRITQDFRTLLVDRRKGLHGLQALDQEIDTYLGGLNSAPLSMRTFFALLLESMGPGPVQQLREFFASFARRWQTTVMRILEKGQQRGLIREDIDTSAQARLFIATLRGLRTQALLDGDRSDLSREIEALKLALRQQLTPPAPKRRRKGENP